MSFLLLYFSIITDYCSFEMPIRATTTAVSHYVRRRQRERRHPRAPWGRYTLFPVFGRFSSRHPTSPYQRSPIVRLSALQVRNRRLVILNTRACETRTRFVSPHRREASSQPTMLRKKLTYRNALPPVLEWQTTSFSYFLLHCLLKSTTSMKLSVKSLKIRNF